jgi:4-diphosphocytidyl-2-C-methyl-D-erythritol kinase
MMAGGRIRLLKRIPSAAGLGGASSDAAAALVAANLVWGLGWPIGRLRSLAAEIGSDVPFFLGPGAAVCRGRGERIEPIPARRLHLVVVKPPIGLKTPEVYGRCRPADEPADPAGLLGALKWGNGAEVGRLLHNRLQEPASGVTPWIGKLKMAFSKTDCLGHQMSGSGSSYFGVCRHARHARRIASRLRGGGLGLASAISTVIAS